nr:MAG TPA: hypothetical protein [Caudoviricetes sp.]
MHSTTRISAALAVCPPVGVTPTRMRRSSACRRPRRLLRSTGGCSSLTGMGWTLVSKWMWRTNYGVGQAV